MIILSNKPNVRGIRSTVKDIKFRTQLIGRDQRLFGGLINTRIYGIAVGFIFALLLVGLPAIWAMMMGG
jgi:tetrahydromethanopterin S-methyltransferase subunit F